MIAGYDTVAALAQPPLTALERDVIVAAKHSSWAVHAKTRCLFPEEKQIQQR
jgi:hypothetical protein